MRNLYSQNRSENTLIAFLIVSLTFILVISTQQQPNLLVNGDFSLNNMGGQNFARFGSNITGWNCTNQCQLVDCIRMNQFWAAYGSYGTNCTGFVIDLISIYLQNVTQNVILGYEYYLLSLNYYYPRANANTKTFQVYFNQEKIFEFTPNVSVYYIPQYLEQRVQGIVGVNTLRMTTRNNSVFDYDGFTVNNVRLIKTTDSLRSLVNNTFLNEFAINMAKIPGSRVILTDFMTFFVNLDRLQLYYFHNRNYSQYATALLANINILNDLKGLLFKSILQQFNPIITTQIESFFSSIDYKYEYAPNIILQRNEDGRGFVSKCYPYFLYNLPGNVMMYLAFLSLFKIVRKRPASRLIRKFSFFGIFIAMIFEGNIESLTYYSIGEMKLFFSTNNQHKFINVFIVFFQLIVTIASVGSVLFFKYHYRRLIFYFVEDKRNNSLGVLCQTIDNGAICLLFGIVHQILFSRPQLQLFILMSLEFAWIFMKVCLIFRKGYKKNFSQFIMLNTGLVRICFIISFYFYESANELRTLINDAYHKGLIIIMIFLLLQELLVSLFQLFLSILKFFIMLGLIKRKGKSAYKKNQKLPLFDDPIRIIEDQIKEGMKKANNTKDHPSLFKNRRNQHDLRLNIKARIFNHQKVNISHLRVLKMLDGNRCDKHLFN